MPSWRRKVPDPPSSFTGAERLWLSQVADAINQLPTFSRFSAAGTPNSYLSGLLGDLAFNMGSASSMSRLWVKIGPETGYSTTSWVAIRILA
mgnify:CR=1 FL=1